MSRVTVCIPTFNRSRLLRFAIESVLDQRENEFELYVVGNHSTDETESMISSFDDPRLKYTKNASNIGHIGNLNRCLELCQGEYLAIMHDDDLYGRDFLDETVRFMDDHGDIGMIFTRSIDIDING